MYSHHSRRHVIAGLSSFALLSSLIVVPITAAPGTLSFSPLPQAQAATPVRVRMDLDTRALYTYADDPTATTRLSETTVSALDANTWLDLSDPANNKVAADGTYCLAVNNSGYTVYINQDGPVTSCTNQTPTSRALVGEARVLTEPEANLTPSSASPTLGSDFTITASGNGIHSEEWIMPDASSRTGRNLSGLSSASTAPKTYTMRAVGTKGERLLSTTVTPQGFVVAIELSGKQGTVGGWDGFQSVSPAATCTPYVTRFPGVPGRYGQRLTGYYTVSSLPLTIDILGVSGGTYGSSGTTYGSLTKTSPVACTIYTTPRRTGSPGKGTQLSVNGTMIAKAAGGNGGASGGWTWNNEYTAANVYRYTSGGYPSGNNFGTTGQLTATSWSTSSQSDNYTKVTLPGGQYAEVFGVGSSITINSPTSLS